MNSINSILILGALVLTSANVQGQDPEGLHPWKSNQSGYETVVPSRKVIATRRGPGNGHASFLYHDEYPEDLLERVKKHFYRNERVVVGHYDELNREFLDFKAQVYAEEIAEFRDSYDVYEELTKRHGTGEIIEFYFIENRMYKFFSLGEGQATIIVEYQRGVQPKLFVTSDGRFSELAVQKGGGFSQGKFILSDIRSFQNYNGETELYRDKVYDHEGGLRRANQGALISVAANDTRLVIGNFLYYEGVAMDLAFNEISAKEFLAAEKTTATPKLKESMKKFLLVKPSAPEVPRFEAAGRYKKVAPTQGTVRTTKIKKAKNK